MDLYQLRYFLEAARELNFTRAADRLRVSPSAVSRSVALLERSVKTKLFARTKRRVVLTASGASLKARAERIFDEVESAALELAGDAAAPARLRLGSRELITNYLLPGPLAEFSARYGATRFGIYALEPRELAEALKKDQLDLGFYYTDIPDPELESRLLGRFGSSVYASKAFLAAHGRPKDARALAALPFIAPRSFRAAPGDPAHDGFPDRKHPRTVRYETEFLETTRRFVLAGLCVGVLPDLAVREEVKRGLLVALESPQIDREVHVFRRRNRALPKAADALVALVKRALDSLRRAASSRGGG